MQLDERLNWKKNSSSIALHLQAVVAFDFTLKQQKSHMIPL